MSAGGSGVGLSDGSCPEHFRRIDANLALRSLKRTNQEIPLRSDLGGVNIFVFRFTSTAVGPAPIVRMRAGSLHPVSRFVVDAAASMPAPISPFSGSHYWLITSTDRVMSCRITGNRSVPDARTRVTETARDVHRSCTSRPALEHCRAGRRRPPRTFRPAGCRGGSRHRNCGWTSRATAHWSR
jgi:hypothetical protein